MAEKPKIQSWWQTLPGLLTAMAGIITAVTGLLVVLYNAGVFESATKDQQPAQITAPVSEAGAGDSRLAESSNLPAGAGHLRETSAEKLAGKASRPAKRINLFAPENGVQLLAASNDSWAATIDGKEEQGQIYYATGKEAVYGFKDEQPATFDTFAMLIGESSDYNVKEFELLAGNDSPTGTFESVGRFQTRNIKLFKTPYQEFRFSPVTARYLKVRVLSTYGGLAHAHVWEYQLFGSLQ